MTYEDVTLLPLLVTLLPLLTPTPPNETLRIASSLFFRLFFILATTREFSDHVKSHGDEEDGDQ